MEVGETMRCFGDRKFAKCDFFSPPICARLAEGPKVCRKACHLSRLLRVKFCLYRLRFVGVFSDKVISYDRNICIHFII